MLGLQPLMRDELVACRTSAHRASDLIAEADQERVNTQAANIWRLDQEWRDAGFEDGHWNPGDELMWEYATRSLTLKKYGERVCTGMSDSSTSMSSTTRPSTTTNSPPAFFHPDFPVDPYLELWQANIGLGWDGTRVGSNAHLLTEADDAISPTIHYRRCAYFPPLPFSD
ncbi:hypothetical protein B0H14DRAFT_3514774 [Mycena olivaceomarginata]|nr:hypothetical protein B0H14DRAFT_3514774 [Mycena olivaceomarginata]